MNTQEIVRSKYFKIAVASVGTLFVVLASFASGVAVGLHKAKFSYAWGENYERNFIGGPRSMMNATWGGMMGRFGFDEGLDSRNFRNAHGISGSVISVSDSSIVISDRENKENTVAATDKTIIKKSGVDIKLSDIAKGDAVVVIGSPSDNGVINADFIRVFGQGTK